MGQRKYGINALMHTNLWANTSQNSIDTFPGIRTRPGSENVLHIVERACLTFGPFRPPLAIVSWLGRGGGGGNRGETAPYSTVLPPCDHGDSESSTEIALTSSIVSFPPSSSLSAKEPSQSLESQMFLVFLRC